jgi:hypothetical protein
MKKEGHGIMSHDTLTEQVQSYQAPGSSHTTHNNQPDPSAMDDYSYLGSLSRGWQILPQW